MMTAIVVIVVLGLLLAALVCPLLTWQSRSISRVYPVAVLCLLVAALLASVYLSLYFSYSPNQNTRVLGWPVPVAVSQRHSQSEPWLDYVGSFPPIAIVVNSIVFVGVSQTGLWLVSTIHRKRAMKST